MAGDVINTTLGATTDLITGYPFKSDLFTESSADIRLLRGDNVAQGFIRWSGAKRWADRENLKDYLLRPGDVVLAMDRPWIEAGLKYATLTEADCPSLLVQRVACLRARTGLDQRFLGYIIRSQAFTNYVLGVQTGTAVPHISGSQIRAFSFKMPPLRVQEAASALLGALDDKIELNRRMAETLEATARALFKSWFIDFNPVHAKSERRSTGLPGVIDELFPSILGTDGLPLGWSMAPMAEYFDITMGQSPPGSTYNESGEGLPFYQGRTDFGFRYPKQRVYCTSPTRFADSGDTLLSVRAPVGDLNLASKKCAIGRGVAAIRHKNGSKSFTYYIMQAIQAKISAFDDSGTVFGSINKRQLGGIEALVVPQHLVNAFDRDASLIDGRIDVALNQSDDLAVLRDTLLPKLMSGELRIREAERAVMAVA